MLTQVWRILFVGGEHEPCPEFFLSGLSLILTPTSRGRCINLVIPNFPRGILSSSKRAPPRNPTRRHAGGGDPRAAGACESTV